MLVDHAEASRWMSGVLRSRVVTPGQDDRNGVGAVRVLLTMAGPVREQVTAFEPPGYLGYEMAPDNPLVRDFRGAVEPREDPDGGTEIDGTLTFEPRLGPTRPVVGQHVVRARWRHPARGRDERVHERASTPGHDVGEWGNVG